MPSTTSRTRNTAAGPPLLFLGRVAAAHLVADVAHRLDEAAGDGAELGAQAPHVDVDGARAAVVAVAPDLGQELLARVDAAAVLREEAEELELLVRELEPPALDARLVAGGVDDQGFHLDEIVGAKGRGSPVELPQARVELRGHDGLENEIG